MESNMELSVQDVSVLVNGFMDRIEKNSTAFEKLHDLSKDTPEVEAVHLERVLLASYGLKWLIEKSLINDAPEHEDTIEYFKELHAMVVPSISTSIDRMGELLVQMAHRDIGKVIKKHADA